MMVKPSNRRKETEGERKEEGRNRKEEVRNRREEEGRKEGKNQQTAKPRKKKSVESKNANKSSTGTGIYIFRLNPPPIGTHGFKILILKGEFTKYLFFYLLLPP